MKQNRIEYLDFLRALACISVVIYHTKMPNDFTENVVSLFFNFCVPVFLMISGALYLNKSYDLTISIIIKKYVLKLLGTIFIFGFIYNFISLTLINHTVNLKIFIDSVWMIIKADTSFCYQFWYLYMLVGLMLFIPVLKPWADKFRKSENPCAELNITCIVFLLFSVIIPTVLKIFEIETFWHGGFTVFYSFLFYMICGFYFYKFNISRKLFYIILSILLVLFAVTIYCLIINNLNLFDKLIGYETLTTFLSSVIIFIIFKNINFNKINQKFKNTVNFIADNSLGIYIYHVLYLMLFLKGIEYSHINLNNVLFTILQFIFALIMSIISTVITKKIPFINRFI